MTSLIETLDHSPLPSIERAKLMVQRPLTLDDRSAIGSTGGSVLEYVDQLLILHMRHLATPELAHYSWTAVDELFGVRGLSIRQAIDAATTTLLAAQYNTDGSAAVADFQPRVMALLAYFLAAESELSIYGGESPSSWVGKQLDELARANLYREFRQAGGLTKSKDVAARQLELLRNPTIWQRNQIRGAQIIEQISKAYLIANPTYFDLRLFGGQGIRNVLRPPTLTSTTNQDLGRQSSHQYIDQLNAEVDRFLATNLKLRVMTLARLRECGHDVSLVELTTRNTLPLPTGRAAEIINTLIPPRPIR
jgi:hypothetical protein